jgi:hypothetical protein
VTLWQVNCSDKPENFCLRLINLSHLDRLTEEIEVDGQSMAVVHIYSEYPDYGWNDATDEGIACVDDVARAAIVYLRYHELTGDVSLLSRIKKYCNFLIFMQNTDGEFYNFITSDHEINFSGRTSIKSFSQWATRAYWALGYAFKIYKPIDIDYARMLKNRFMLCKVPLRKNLQRYGEFQTIHGKSYPFWLVNDYAADATSEFILGMAYVLETEQDGDLVRMAGQLADGILKMQQGSSDSYGGAFLSWPGLWHAWSNSQSAALAHLGHLLHEPRWISAAENEAEQFYRLLIEDTMLHAVAIQEKRTEEFPQIAYDIRPMVAGLVSLHQITGKTEYARLAGLAAAWLLGRNAAGTVMYDARTGRGYDGIDHPQKVNRNAGAESTIEALLTLLEIAADPIACEAMMAGGM